MVRLFGVVAFGFCIGFTLGLQISKRTVTSQYVNSTSTRVASGTSASNGQICCYIFPHGVALNFWYTSTVAITNATVVTEYLQYNNTVVPTATSTIPLNSSIDLGFFNANGGSVPRISGVPTDLAGIFYDGQYDATSVLTGSVYDDDFTTIVSPTPFMTYDHVYIFPGHLNGGGTCMGSTFTVWSATTVTYTTDGLTSATSYPPLTEVLPDDSATYVVEEAGSLLVGEAGDGDLGSVGPTTVSYIGVSLSTPYYDFATNSESWNNFIAPVGIGPDMFSWLANNPSILSIYPDITRCVAAVGDGAPTVHIQVSLLTSTNARTVTTNAIYTKSGQSTPASPASKTPSSIVAATSTSKPALSTSSQQKSHSSDISSPSQASPTSSETHSSVVASPNQISSGSTKDTDASISQKPVASSLSSTVPVETTSQVQVPNPKPSTPHGISANSQGSVATDSISDSTTNLGGPQDVGNTQIPTADGQTSQPTPRPKLLETAATSLSALTIGSHAFSYASGSSSNVIVGSQSLVVGGSAVTVSSDTISLASSGIVVVNGVSTPLEPQTRIPASVVAFASAAATALASGAYVIESKTISAGGPVAVVSGTTYSVLPSGNSVVANGESLPISAFSTPAETHVEIGSITATPAPSGIYIAEGKTLSPGGSAVEISGTTYSLPTSGNNVVINGQTLQVNSIIATEASPVLIGEITATHVSSGAYVVGGQTVSRGGSAVEVSGTTYSLPISGNNVVINGQTSAIFSPTPPVIFGSMIATPVSSNAYIIAGQTLNPEHPAVTVSGTTYSLPSSGSNIVINGETTPIESVASATSPVLLGSITATPLQSSAYLIASQTLKPGGSALTISGTTYSLPTSGSNIIINGSPTPIVSGLPEVVTLGSSIYTPSPAPTALVIDSQTLRPGSVITIGSETISLPRTGSVIVVNGITTAIPAASSALVFGSQTLRFSELASGIVVAGQTLYPGGPPVTVGGETLRMSGSALVEASGGVQTTVGLGGYIMSGVGGTAATSAGVSSSRKLGSGVSSATNSGASGSGTSTAISMSASTSATEGSGEGAAAASTTTGAGHRLERLRVWHSITVIAVLSYFVL